MELPEPERMLEVSCCAGDEEEEDISGNSTQMPFSEADSHISDQNMELFEFGEQDGESSFRLIAEINSEI